MQTSPIHRNKRNVIATGHRQRMLSALGSLAVLSSAVPVFATDDPAQASSPPSSGDWLKPVWLTDVSLGVQESHDSNVYLLGVNAAAPVPGYNNATANKSSWITTISPKVAVDLAKLLGDGSILKTFALGYAGDFNIFHDATEETFSAHRFTTNIKAGSDSVQFNLDNTFTYIDGNDSSVVYPGSPQSRFANNAVRERLNQWQERTQASLKVDVGPYVFIRPVFSLLYYDLGTDFSAASGYLNFIDRYDVNGGLDAGYNVTKDLALTLGYRYGYQYQAALPASVTTATTLGRNASNDYQRILAGVEGRPVKWLNLQASVGPEYITYTDARPYVYGVKANGQIPLDRTDIYAEALATVTLSDADSLVFKWKRWDWVSSTGVYAYRDTTYSGTYRHQFSDAFSVEAGLNAQQHYYLPSSLRNDWQYTASIGAKYAVTKNLILNLSYSYIRGLNDQDFGITSTQATDRQFVDNLVSFGATWKY